MLNWYAITSTAYYAAEEDTLSAENLYFLTDTHEIYRGTVPFTDAVITYTGEKPTSPARKKIYINTATLQGEIYDGTSWTTVIKPVSTQVTDGDGNPVSGDAVHAYVAAQLETLASSENTIKSLSYDNGTFQLTVTKGNDSTEKILLDKLGVDLQYNSGTGLLQLKDATGTAVGTGINLDLERFVNGASYDDATKTITLWFDDVESADLSKDKIEIPVADLVDTYTAGDTQTVHMDVSGNQFTASVIVSTTGGNMLQATANGLYVAATDLSNYQTLVESASTTMIPMLNGDGQIINGTMTPGGATLAGTPNATTLATEAAVKAAIDTAIQNITTSLTNKMDKVASAVVGNIPTFTTGGNVADSGKKIGGATLAGSPDANTVATEVAVNAAITSAVAVVDAKVTTLNANSDTPGSVDYKIAQATTNMLESTDIVTELNNSVTNQQVPSAKVVYDQLVWKTSL